MSIAAPAGKFVRDSGPKNIGETDRLAFEFPPELAASEPPEARGVARDGVRMMISDREGERIRHASFRDLPDLLAPGDLLVVNSSATINASLDAHWEVGDRAGEPVEVHLSTPVPGDLEDHWVIELRKPAWNGTMPLLDARRGGVLSLEHGGSITLLEPYRRPDGAPTSHPELVRLWIARLECAGGVLRYASRHGRPIRYQYVRRDWPLDAYQTLFSREPGSAEMPSAGRPFTRGVAARLLSAGVRIAPLVLHTGVASLESHESPYPERYQVSLATAAAVNAAREQGHRVIAVGTTVIRALETVASPSGRVSADEGWTDLIISPRTGIQTVDGMLTGLHEPRSSHLSMLEALVGRAHLEATYHEALEQRYLWHEFGDVHLMFR